MFVDAPMDVEIMAYLADDWDMDLAGFDQWLGRRNVIILIVCLLIASSLSRDALPLLANVGVFV